MRKRWQSTPTTVFAWIGVVVAFVIGVPLLVGHAFRERIVIVSSPSPPSVMVDGRLPLAPGDEACLKPIRFTPEAGRIRLVVQTRANPVPPLRVIARAGKTVKSTVVRDYAPGPVTAIFVPFKVNGLQGGSVCIANEGSNRVALASTNEPRYASLTKTTVNGKPSEFNMQASLQLVTSGQESIVQRIPQAVRHDAQLTGVLPPALVWLLLFAVLAAIIAGPLYVMTDVLRRDDDEASG